MDIQGTVDPKALEQLFYSKPFSFSYSGLNKLLYSPKLFYKHYVLNQKEDSDDKHLIAGKAIHCLLLDETTFNSQFIVSLTDTPKDKNKTVVLKVLEHYKQCSAEEGNTKIEMKDFEQEILTAMRDEDFYQNLKTDAQRVEKALSEQNVAYFNHLKNSEGKSIIDQVTYDFCKDSVQLIKANERVADLLKLNVSEMPIYDVINEKMMEMQLPGYSFGIRGIIDNVVIDHSSKTIYINDLKTSGKTLADFAESIDYWHYWIQAAMYVTLVRGNILDKMENSEGWKIVFHFIVIDQYKQVYAFEVTTETMTTWMSELTRVLGEAEFHYSERFYDLPYTFAKAQVKL